MEENARYHLMFLHLDEEIFKWDTAITPIIPRQGEDVFLVTDLPRRNEGKWWTVQDVAYLYRIGESSAELHQHITIHIELVKLKK